MRYLVGIYGGMGSGKSTVMARLEALGASVISADRVNAEVMCTPAYIRGVEQLCPQCVTPDGVDKAVLRAWMVQDEGRRQALMALAHPLIRDEILRSTIDGLWFVELSVYTPHYLELDDSWVVRCHPRTQLARVLTRGGCTEGEAEAMIDAQYRQGVAPPDAQPILNDGTEAELCAKVDAMYTAILARLHS